MIGKIPTRLTKIQRKYLELFGIRFRDRFRKAEIQRIRKEGY